MKQLDIYYTDGSMDSLIENESLTELSVETSEGDTTVAVLYRLDGKACVKLVAVNAMQKMDMFDMVEKKRTG